MKSGFLSTEDLGKAFVPKRFRPEIRSYFLKAGITTIPYKIFGILFYITAIITGIIYFLFVFPYAAEWGAFVLLVGTFIAWSIIQIALAAIFISIIYFYADLKIYNRTKMMEDVLPDFLQVLSSNIKGGMTFEKALWAAINPRFRVLSEEIAIAAKKVMTGEEVSVALEEFVEKYDSPTLRRSMELIMGEIEGGGKISEIIDKVVENLKETKALKEEMSASALSYVIFISVIVILIAPGLFALSYNLIIMIGNFASQLSVGNVASAGVNIPINFGGISVDPSMFKNFSYASLSVIAIFSSMIVSIIQKGNIKGGVKFIPLFIAGTVAFYTIFMKVLDYAFSGLMA